MPFIRLNYCANPVACRKADRRIYKIRYKRNDSAWYAFNHDDYSHISYHIHKNYGW